MPSKINDKIVEKGAEMLRGMLIDYKDELDVAYLNSDGDKGLTVALTLKFSAGKNDTMGIDAGINFVESRIKDSASAYMNPHQDELPFDAPVVTQRKTYLWQERMSADLTGSAYVHYEKVA